MPLLSSPLSLRGRILLLFFALTVLPVTVVAGLYYFYPEPYPLEDDGQPGGGLENRLVLSARALSLRRAQVVLAVEQAAAALASTGSAPEGSGTPVDPDRLRGLLQDVPGWSSARLVGADGTPLVEARGRPPEAEAAPCTELAAADPIVLGVPVRATGGGSGARLNVEIAAAAFLDALLLSGDGANSHVSVVDDRTGARIFRWDCVQPTAATAAVPEDAEADGGSEASGASSSRQMAQSVEGLPWTVHIGSRSPEAFLLVRRDRLVVVGIVLGFALLAGLLFTVILTHVMRSLDEVMGAAEQIRRGDLTPWLPLPGDDEVGRLSMAFGRMVGALQKAQRELEQQGRQAMAGELSAMVAHEVRNPLSSVKLNLQGMARWLAAREDRGESPIMVETCLREVDRLNRVVSSILELGRPREGARRPASLHEIIQDTVLLLQRKIEGSGTRVELDLAAPQDRVTGSPDQLKSIFINLVLNANRAMMDDGGGVLRISTRLHRDMEGRWEIVTRVSDTGRGVPPERREEIFHPFRTNRVDGSGIGLPLSRRIADDHGGRLTCEKESELTPGAEFVLRLPLLQEEADEEEEGGRGVGIEARRPQTQDPVSGPAR